MNAFRSDARRPLLLSSVILSALVSTDLPNDAAITPATAKKEVLLVMYRDTFLHAVDIDCMFSYMP